MLLEKILFATDFTEVSDYALGVVRQLREAGCNDVVLVHVVDERDMREIIAQPGGVGDPEPEGEFERKISNRIIDGARESLGAVAMALEKAGFGVKSYLLVGVPEQQILRIADAERVGIVIVGSSGGTSLRHIIRGSVSEKVIRDAKVPVLVVRQAYEE